MCWHNVFQHLSNKKIQFLEILQTKEIKIESKFVKNFNVKIIIFIHFMSTLLIVRKNIDKFQNKKRFYDRETISALIYEITVNVFPFPLYTTQIINLFLNSRI